jgi:hypothetical protein
MDGAVLLQTRTHVAGDRDFLFSYLRDLCRLARRARHDEAAQLAFFEQMMALEAFVEEDNIQGKTSDC